MKKAVSRLISALFPETLKSWSEYRYWKKRREAEGDLSNDHYSWFYTGHFGLDKGFYENKKVLDIGCGPRGSLEWAGHAARRVGLDPLADRYLKLGADRHEMEYVASGSEEIPFPDGMFDIVTAFNSLDHVSDIGQTIREIKRVTAQDGLFLLLVEINCEPTHCEPHTVGPEITEQFKPEFECVDKRVFEPVKEGLYESIRQDVERAEPEWGKSPAWLSAKFVRLGQGT
ncbi:MAG: class I SAM-dependent methyltransferase [Balneolaceae bacterium]